jgi:hypothetical protein
MVLFKNLTDVSQIMALAHQMYPRRTHFFLEAFDQATQNIFGTLTQTVDETAIGFGYEVFTNTWFRLL